MQTLQTIHPELLKLSSEQVSLLMPYLVVFGGAVLAMLASVMKLVNPKWPVFIITLATVVAGVFFAMQTMAHVPEPMFNGMMIADRFSGFFNVIFLCSAGLTT